MFSRLVSILERNRHVQITTCTPEISPLTHTPVCFFPQSPFAGEDEEDLFDSICRDKVHYPKWISNNAEDCLSQVGNIKGRLRDAAPACIYVTGTLSSTLSSSSHFKENLKERRCKRFLFWPSVA